MLQPLVTGILKGVLAMELADGDLAKEERKLLSKLVDRFGLEEGELAEAVGDAKKLDAEQLRERLDHEDRVTVAQYAYMAAYADGKLDKKEARFLADLEKQLGLSAKDVKKLERLGLELAKIASKRPVNVDRLAEVVETFA